MSEILNKAKDIEGYVINLRREFHKYPELSGKEFKTQEMVIKELENMGIPYKKVGNTSVVAMLNGKKEGKTIALRADMDALPIIEESGVEFSSKTHGLMHACGHDAHTAMLLGAAKVLSEMKDEINGNIKFFFQEGEETFTGAKEIIKDGGMDGVDACFGLHCMPDLETGYVNIDSGYKMAGCDTIYVKFEGVSGHGSSPHLAKDTIYPACTFVSGLQAIATKNIDPQEPVVLTVGKFIGGTKANIIPKYTNLDISMRYFNPKVREIVHQSIKRHAKAIAEAYEIKIDVNIEESAISLYNDKELSIIAKNSAKKILGEGKTVSGAKLMGSEDFPYYLKYAKGVYAYLGYNNKEKDSIYYPHHEKFKIDEDCFKYGVALHVQFALDFFNEN
ncbi:amidohydrolase [Paraclostridium sordellii]|uniref:Amidohydrolase n=1 Tax=Paraclostridium sordellii TaxID=1505 RepID=A0A0C7QSD8_PARSO|nr:amidohydrolase [Paeniclostridium sordellii]CEN78486.1 amidohydrolase [[Clostridium] sordellii] [Paeniclostridium sordellii]CEQ03582.1 amidohydrolase [[Clostridium] sordellii] [Paeniclostridium sordellii]